MPEWLKWLIVTFGALLLGYLAKLFNWFGNFLRFRPKDKIEVKKVEQEIHSSQVDDEIKIGKIAMELVVNVTAQLDKANEKLILEEQENGRLRDLVTTLRDEMESSREAFFRRIEALEKAVRDGAAALNEERNHCNSIRKELSDLKLKYDIK